MIKEDNLAIRMVDWLITKGCPINFVDMIGQTCLFYTAREGRLELTTHLIKSGVNINHVDTYG